MSYRGRARIYFDGIVGITVREKDVRHCKISVGEETEPNEIEQRVRDLQMEDCFDSAIRVLERSDRSEMQMKRKLRDLGYIEEVCDLTLKRLIEIGYLNDARITERMVESASKRAVGTNYVRQKLLSKGLSMDLIDNAMDILDDEQQTEACRKALPPLLKRYASIDPREARKKIGASLARKGFSWDTISTVLSENRYDEQ